MKRRKVNEAKTEVGCPIAEEQIVQGHEKFLVLTRPLTGHTCGNKWLVVMIVSWDGLPAKVANKAFQILPPTIGFFYSN